jgi:hypothetical protein
MALGELSLLEIAENVGVSRATLWSWKTHPQFKARVDDLVDAMHEAVKRWAIARVERRVEWLNRDWFRMQRVIEERSRDPGMQKFPGASTGLLFRRVKGVGRGDNRALESASFLVFDGTDDGRERDRLRGLWAAAILLDLPMPRLVGLKAVRSARGRDDKVPHGAIVLVHGRRLVPAAAACIEAIGLRVGTLPPETVRTMVNAILYPAPSARPGPSRPKLFVVFEPIALRSPLDRGGKRARGRPAA